MRPKETKGKRSVRGKEGKKGEVRGGDGTEGTPGVKGGGKEIEDKVRKSGLRGEKMKG